MDLQINGHSIYNSRWIAAIFLLILIEPACFERVEPVDTVFDILILLSVCVLFLCSILNGKITRPMAWTYAFFGVIFLCTVLGSGEVISYFKEYCACFAMCLMIVLWMEKNPKILLDSFAILELYVYLNLLTVILFPNGLYKSDLYTTNWFLGFKNVQIRTILPIITMSLIRSYWKHAKISVSCCILIACSALTFVLVRSATSLVGFGVFLLLLVFFHRKNRRLPKILSLFNCAAVSGIAFWCFAVLGLQNALSWVFHDILGKDLTFHTRTQLWTSVLDVLKEHILFGHGYMSTVSYSEMFQSAYYTHPHNLYLYILMTGGLCLLLVFVVGICFAHQKLKENIAGISSKILLYCLCAFFIMGIAESLTGTVLFYPMIIFAMNADQIPEPAKSLEHPKKEDAGMAGMHQSCQMVGKWGKQ